MNKTLLERQPNNKRIATTESLQKRFFNGSKNHVMEIEKLICHHSATKEHINFGYTILFLNYFYFSCHKAGRMAYGTTATTLWYDSYHSVVFLLSSGGIGKIARRYCIKETGWKSFGGRGGKGNNCLCFLIIKRLTLILHAQIGE